MEIICVNVENQEAYDAFVQIHGGELFQSFAWGEFQKKTPGRGAFWALGVKVKGKWMASVLLSQQKLPLGLCWLSIARGPVFAESEKSSMLWGVLWAEIYRIAFEEKAVFLRVEPAERCAAALFAPAEKGNDAHSAESHDTHATLALARASWRPAHAHYQPEWTLRVDLRPSEEEVLKQMESKGRYNVRLAERKGVTVRSTSAPEDAVLFYQLLQKTGARDQFGIHPASYYQTFLAEAARGDWGTLMLAEVEGRPIAGALVTFYGKTGMYFYGASDHTHRSLMAPYLVQWEAMREAKRRGCEWYDFLGIAPPDDPRHAWRGVTEFKEKFGGVKVRYPEAREFVFRGFWYFLIRVVKKFRR